MASKCVEIPLFKTLVQTGGVRILWGALFALAVCSLIVIRPWRSKSSRTLFISRVGNDPNQISLAAARKDFMINGHSLIKEGYMNVGFVSILH